MNAQLMQALHRAAMAGSGVLSSFRSGPTEATIPTSPNYVCPPSSELPRLLAGLCTALQVAVTSCDAWDAHLAAAFALWSLCYLHLFSDGNGRTARGLAVVILARAGAVQVCAESLHRFHAHFREHAVRRRYFEALQATTDALHHLNDLVAAPPEAFAQLALVVAAAAKAAQIGIAVQLKTKRSQPEIADGTE
eukprot:4782158-Prymnesium_polylepis.1